MVRILLKILARHYLGQENTSLFLQAINDKSIYKKYKGTLMRIFIYCSEKGHITDVHIGFLKRVLNNA